MREDIPFHRILLRPVGALYRRCSAALEKARYARGTDYDAAGYWRRRHERYGFDLRGVGDRTISHEDNCSILRHEAGNFLRICADAGIRLAGADVIDIGCGAGSFTAVVKAQGAASYLGVDIAETLLPGLRAQYPGYRFERLDVATEPMSGAYSLVLAMDVLQHITDEGKFLFALRNIRDHLTPDGSVVISTHIGPACRQGFYAVRRPLAAFEQAFSGYRIGSPVPLANSMMFSITPVLPPD